MVKENERFVSNTNSSKFQNSNSNNLTDIWWQRCSADVFSIQAIIYTIHMCVSSISCNRVAEGLIVQVLTGCCEDPVVHERITAPMYRWIAEKAPGIRSSLGCPKKLLDYEPSLRISQMIFKKPLIIIHSIFRLCRWMELLSSHPTLLPTFPHQS